MSEFLKPLPLETNDPVGLVTPVNLPPKKYWANDKILEYLGNRGYIPEDFSSNGDTPRQRSDSFNRALESDCKALFPVAGNRYSKDILSKIDYDAFRRQRPIFTTFSAASTVLLALHYRANTGVFYGPHISFIHTQSQMRENQYTVSSYWNMLERSGDVEGVPDELAEYTFKWNTDEGIVLKNIFNAGLDPTSIDSEPIPFIGKRNDQSSPKVQGRLLPTFLQSLHRALEYGIEIDLKDRILLIESDEIGFEEADKIIDRVMKSSNLGSASAIVLTSFITHTNPPNVGLEQELYNIDNINRFVKSTQDTVGDNVPVIFGFPLGHQKYKLTVPMGINAELNTETGDIELLEDVYDTTHK